MGPEDWRLWRRLRRAALQEAPDAFGSTLTQWSGAGDTEERWRDRLSDVPLNLVLLLEGEPAGMVSATSPDREGQVELISLWVDPTARGRGVAHEAIRQVLDWAAEEHPASRVVLSVADGNLPARQLYRRHGFTDAGPSPLTAGERLMRR